MKAIIKNKKALIWAVLIIAMAVIIFMNWTDLSAGFKDGYNGVAK